MKRLIMIGVVILLSMGLFGATATVSLTGTIPSAVEITFTEQNLPLDLTTTVVDTTIGVITEKANTGYNITVSSTNAGKLIGNATAEELVYTAKYDGVAITLSSTAVEILANGVKTSGVDKIFTISYTIVAYELSPDLYEYDLVFVITAN